MSICQLLSLLSSTLCKDRLPNHLAYQAKFHLHPPWEGAMKVCINGPGHMNKMGAVARVVACPLRMQAV